MLRQGKWYFSSYHSSLHNWKLVSPSSGLLIMDSPDLLQVSDSLQDEDNGEGDTASEAFVCGICSKSLKNKESLRKHKKTHTIEPSTCEVCDKQFKSKGLLSKHRKCTLVIPVIKDLRQ